MSSFLVELCQRIELARLADEVGRVRQEAAKAAAKQLAEDIVARMKAGGILTQEEVAWVLNVSSRQVRRLEKRGIIRRCPNLGGAVGYPASDVHRLASVRPWKED
jgi:hypothetical protein